LLFSNISYIFSVLTWSASSSLNLNVLNYSQCFVLLKIASIHCIIWIFVFQAEEQATDETYEQYEERVLNKRAAQMYHIIKSKLDVDTSIPFSTMCTVRNTRKQVAQKFYTMLVLKKAQAVELTQNSSYDNILVTKGPKFLTASL